MAKSGNISFKLPTLQINFKLGKLNEILIENNTKQKKMHLINFKKSVFFFWNVHVFYYCLTNF